MGASLLALAKSIYYMCVEATNVIINHKCNEALKCNTNC